LTSDDPKWSYRFPINNIVELSHSQECIAGVEPNEDTSGALLVQKLILHITNRRKLSNFTHLDVNACRLHLGELEIDNNVSVIHVI